MQILAFSGSLRAQSSNKSLLLAVQRLAPPEVKFKLFEGIDRLPHFNPDLEEDPPQPVIELREKIASADALLISCPEYAHGVPGSLKNMLDWLVSSVEFVGKPVGLLNPAPHSVYAQAALREILTVMSARIVETACLTLPISGRLRTEAEILANAEICTSLQSIFPALRTVIVPDTHQ